MFLHLSVSHSVHSGEYLGRHTPQDQVHPRDQLHPLGPGTPWDQAQPPRQVHPLGPGVPPWDQVHPPGQVHPTDQVHPLGPGTPFWDQVHPPGTRYTPQAGTSPRAVHAGRYGQQAGGTHPTGMHSYSKCVWVWWRI